METGNLFDIIKFTVLSLISFDSDYLHCNEKNELVGSGLGSLGELKSAAEAEGIDTTEVAKNVGLLISKELLIFLNEIKNTVIRYFMVVVMFFLYGSVYPALPLFGILAGMFAVIKYFIYKFRKF